ncbi:hypothetical protein R1sor_008615 [Riccia sorocarpa]|uniref:Uncharacterized protein n=1 Tax=Riccia sorocarpa TaxID=122646 RepID=A0ABD3HXD1_9MARC
MDVLMREELAECIMCDREFLCSDLVEEFINGVVNLQKMKVRLMHSEQQTGGYTGLKHRHALYNNSLIAGRSHD